MCTVFGYDTDEKGVGDKHANSMSAANKLELVQLLRVKVKDKGNTRCYLSLFVVGPVNNSSDGKRNYLVIYLRLF